MSADCCVFGASKGLNTTYSVKCALSKAKVGKHLVDDDLQKVLDGEVSQTRESSPLYRRSLGYTLF